MDARAEPTSRLAGARFELLGHAGDGGACEVLRARAESGRLVALKLARGDEGRLSLAREAAHAALALSPRLPELVGAGWLVVRASEARVVDRGTATDERAFVALRWTDGRPLRELLDGARADAVDALGIVADVAEALEDLHGLGLAHGDVKPENVLVDARGRAFLIDLGLTGPAWELEVRGGTPRYLARGDRELGDARARDLLALGVMASELADPAIARAADAVAAARGRALPPPFDAICKALLTPAPAARPSAAWVADAARAARSVRAAAGRGSGARHEKRPRGGERAENGAPRTAWQVDDADEQRERGECDARRVRAAYLRVRRADLEDPRATAAPGTCAWLREGLEAASLALALGVRPGVGETAPRDDASAARERSPRVLEPLEPERIARWLVALVGGAAAAWPVDGLAAAPERDVAEGLTALARARSPAAWTLDLVESAVRAAHAGAAPAPPAPASIAPKASEERDVVARLAIALSRVPADLLAIEAVERSDDAPASLVLAAADALRLRGEHGRAASLLQRPTVRGDDEARALAVEVWRRAGRLEEARAEASALLAEGRDSSGRARAALARMALDAGEVAEAERIAAEPRTPGLCEVGALVASARGDRPVAMRLVDRGAAMARTAEERARLEAVRGYLHHAIAPGVARASYATAVDHAVRAGALVEEATYRTSEAAVAVDVGDLDGAIATARRAALLWEHLERPALAARAWLARAAAYATAGLRHETMRAAETAIALARAAGDQRAEAYAWWAIADASGGDPNTALAAARRARERLGDDAAPDDRLRAEARLLGRDPAGCDEAHVAELDRLAATGSVSAAARLEWWGARARDLAARDATERVPEALATAVVTSLAALADAAAPIAARGPALAAGVELAVKMGFGELAARLRASLYEVARALVARASPALEPAVRALPWVAAASPLAAADLAPEQARDLEVIVQSLGERERLSALLARIVDAMVLWTGVERGLLLLRAPDGRLVPRAARNLVRADLRGEQLALSQTLARKALDACEPVVAVDAAGELPAVHESVHALKLRSVLAVPLVARGTALGVVYLDDRVRRGAFGPRELRWVRTIASLAALAIDDARAQALLRRAARRAERAKAELGAMLAQREAALDAAERELARARGSRGTRFAYDEIVGESGAIRSLLRIVDRVTASEVPVLVAGESGSGKELVARAIHANGPRAGRPFVSENCGAIPETLLESALFGHVRGAFTGADRPRAGLFEIADGGTLFLDEVGEMSLAMQAKLLRVIEDGVVRPLGSERARRVDVRVIAATNRDLERMVREKAFREDLLYRLAIITVRVPPLRERAEDIPLIVQHLVRKHAAGRRVRVTRAAMDRLSSYAWPGNVRQLENEVRRALVLCDGVIDREHLSREVAGDDAPAHARGTNLRARLDALETELVRDALARTKGNQTQAAKLLGVSRFGLQKMIRRLGIAAS